MIGKVRTVLFAWCISVASAFALEYRAPDRSLFMASLEFPRSINTVPHYRIYYAGNKIQSSADHESKQLTFTIPEFKRGAPLWLLVTEQIQFAAEDNIVHYLKLAEGQPYKLFRLARVQKEIDKVTNTALMTRLGSSHTTQSNQTPRYEWQISEHDIRLNGRVPDNAIILCCNPDYVSHLEGGHATQLPKIVMHEALLSIAGTEKQLHDEEISLLLSSIDYNTLHGKIKQEIKPRYQLKTILALTI